MPYSGTEFLTGYTVCHPTVECRGVISQLGLVLG